MPVPEGVITTTDILQAEVVQEVVPVEEELPVEENEDANDSTATVEE
jgi:hypothetical protein